MNRWASPWSYLDITALGRQEDWEDSPDGYPQTPPYEWWISHDEPGGDTCGTRTSVVCRWKRASHRW